MTSAKVFLRILNKLFKFGDNTSSHCENNLIGDERN
jgi:hypothetical protein